MPGRTRKPRALRVIEGNPGKRALTKNEPKPIGKIGAAPEHLTANQKKLWSELVKFAAPGVLTSADRHHIEATVYLLEEIRTGANRAASMFSIFERHLAKIGGNPSDRTRISLDQETPENEFDEFLTPYPKKGWGASVPGD